MKDAERLQRLEERLERLETKLSQLYSAHLYGKQEMASGDGDLGKRLDRIVYQLRVGLNMPDLDDQQGS